MQQIPLQAVPSQTRTIVLAGQNCQLNIYSIGQSTNLFFDLNSNGVDIVTGVIVENGVFLVCIQYLGFQGNFLFIDTTNANNDPEYAGLGTQYELVYLTAAEYDLIVQ